MKKFWIEILVAVVILGGFAYLIPTVSADVGDIGEG